ncbi:DUF4193 family protein [Propioniciclava flava]
MLRAVALCAPPTLTAGTDSGADLAGKQGRRRACHHQPGACSALPSVIPAVACSGPQQLRPQDPLSGASQVITRGTVRGILRPQRWPRPDRSSPEQKDEFTCTRCFLVHHHSQLVSTVGSEPAVCAECATE